MVVEGAGPAGPLLAKDPEAPETNSPIENAFYPSQTKIRRMPRFIKLDLITLIEWLPEASVPNLG
jgi:hypothetical protein